MTDVTVPTQLPLFEGHRPTGAGVRLTGKVTTPFRALSLDEEVVLVVKATVSKVSHERDGDAGLMTRLHVLKVSEAHELPGDQADMALVEGQVWSRKIADSYAGKLPLEGGGP